MICISQGADRGYSGGVHLRVEPAQPFHAAAHSTLLSRRPGRRPDAFNKQRTTDPAQSHYCVEGAIMRGVDWISR